MKTSKIINEITETIKINFDPDKIILFGSYAYGNPAEDSDIDIYIIKNDLKMEEIRKNKLFILDKLRNLILKNRIDVDILINNEKIIQDRIRTGDLFLEEIINKGKIIYAK